jgi:hypothetical protein
MEEWQKGKDMMRVKKKNQRGGGKTMTVSGAYSRYYNLLYKDKDYAARLYVFTD